MIAKKDTVLVAGSTGLVGSAILRKLKNNNYINVIAPTHKELDLTNQQHTNAFFKEYKPNYVYLCAAKVGGILANMSYPAEFAYCNQMIQNNVIHASMLYGVKKLIILGSSCIYPKMCNQPIKEEYLLSGLLEETNKPYAIAKIAGLITAKAYHDQYGLNVICAMPTNLYGPNDNFDLKTSHVLPALIRKFHEALPRKDVVLWGTGTARREFLYSDDLADALLFLAGNYNDPSPINIGCGIDITIKDLAFIIQKIVGHKGKIVWDHSKPDGTPRKLLDISKITELGWKPKTDLVDGLLKTYEWYKTNVAL